MNFQEKVTEASTELQARAARFAHSALHTARTGADLASRRARRSLTVLNGVGRQFNKVARRHAARFLEQNARLAAAAGKDVSALARTTFASLGTRATAKKPARARVARQSSRARRG